MCATTPRTSGATSSTGAGLEVEQTECFEKTHPLEPWLARTGCEGEEAERVKELLPTG